MTEQEWLESTNPHKMLLFLGRKASSRRRRLFACACYRHVPSLLVEQPCLNAVMLSERYADGMASKEELCKALNGAIALFPWHWPSSLPTARYAEQARGIAARASQDGLVERLYQANILRCLFGNPLRHVTINPAWLAWNDGMVRRIAPGIYDERAFDRLPILADALTDAGCDNADILNHCRSEGPHVKGCWVVDALLGKE